MPSQGHLYIGRRVATAQDVRAMVLALGADPAKVAANPDLLEEGWHEAAALGIPEREVVLGGTAYDATPRLVLTDEDPEFPAKPGCGDYTGALLGFPLTSRYAGAILDAAYTNGGRPEPFAIDLAAAADLLAQVRAWWPEAELLMMDEFF